MTDNYQGHGKPVRYLKFSSNDYANLFLSCDAKKISPQINMPRVNYGGINLKNYLPGEVLYRFKIYVMILL